jgi:methyl-accepting chemotaxis protein
MNIRNLGIRTKLLLLALLGLAFVLTVATAGYRGVGQLQHASQDMRGKFSALRNTLEADMMHDAVRSDVLATLRAASLNDSVQLEATAQDLKDHGALFRDALAKNDALAVNPAIKTALGQVKPHLVAYLAEAEQIAQLAQSDAAAANVRLPEFQRVFVTLEDEQRKLHDLVEASNNASSKQMDAAAATANTTLLAVTLLASVALLALSRLLGQHVLRSLHQALGMAKRIGHGDLEERSTTVRSTDETGQLINAMNQMRHALADIVGQVRRGAAAVQTAAEQIGHDNEHLAHRTEQQAATLEETAASTEELAATIRESAQDARDASQRAANAADAAIRGGHIVEETVHTMHEVNASANRIADITAIIDGIAFQTNILALNAAVEAARAGEQGKGFAVVATEVRALAQRSAAAAKEIKELIATSTTKLQNGTALVAQTGTAMDEIITAVKSVTDLIARVAATTHEQGQGIDQVNQAITQLDQVAQQNAAQVEAASAAGQSLRNEVQGLTELVAQFKITQTTEFDTVDRAVLPQALSRAPMQDARRLLIR